MNMGWLLDQDAGLGFLVMGFILLMDLCLLAKGMDMPECENFHLDGDGPT